MITKSCAYCNKEFETLNINKKCCSHSCSIKLLWSNPGHKERMCKIQSEVQNRQARKNHQSKKIKEKFENDPAYRDTIKNNVLKTWSDPTFKEKMSCIQKEAQNKPTTKKQRSESLKKYWNQPDVRHDWSVFQKKYQNLPEVKEQTRERSLEHWKDEYAHKVLTSGKIYKSYIMPSGKVVKVQGYEHIVLDNLIETYNEDDIFVGAKEINKEIGKITYTCSDNTEHTYIPDIYIKSKNLIIEVKSKHWFDFHKERNFIKERACIARGFNFEFVILP